MAKATKKTTATTTTKLPDMRGWTDEQIAAYFDAEQIAEETCEGVEFSMDGDVVVATDTRTGETKRLANNTKWLLDF